MTSINPEISCIQMGFGPALSGLARFYCIVKIVKSQGGKLGPGGGGRKNPLNAALHTTYGLCMIIEL